LTSCTDLTAKAEVLAAAVDELYAQHVVAHTANTGARWPAQAGGHHTAAGAVGVAKARWLKGQALAFFSQCGFELGQWRAGTHGDHQFAGLVANDALVRCGVEQLALQRFAIKVFAAAAANAQWGALCRSSLNVINEVLQGGVHGYSRVKRWPRC